MAHISRQSRIAHAVANGRQFGSVWCFETKRFSVTLNLTQIFDYEYDGEDDDGETQRKINAGEYVVFESSVMVEFEGDLIGEDILFGSVYLEGRTSEFFKEHKFGYFKDMVSEACRRARDTLAQRAKSLPYIRAA